MAHIIKVQISNNSRQTECHLRNKVDLTYVLDCSDIFKVGMVEEIKFTLQDGWKDE